MIRKKVLNDIQQGLTSGPLPCKAQATFLGVMTEHAKLLREKIDMRWVDAGLRVSAATPLGRTPPSQ